MLNLVPFPTIRKYMSIRQSVAKGFASHFVWKKSMTCNAIGTNPLITQKITDIKKFSVLDVVSSMSFTELQLWL